MSTLRDTPLRDTLNRWAHQPDLGLLLIRAIAGVVFLFHGAQKLFGWFDGMGISAFAGFLGSIGVPLPTLNAWLAASVEFFGGALLILGVATRLASIPLFITMVVAIVTVHPSAFSSAKNGMEFPLLLGLVTLALLFTGPGRYTAAALLNGRRNELPATGAVPQHA